MGMEKVLIVDLSPILYGNLFSGTNVATRTPGFKVSKEVVDVDGESVTKYNLDDYWDIVAFKIIEEIGNLRNKFQLSIHEELILAVDNPTSEGYWRKDVFKGYKDTRKDIRDSSNVQWDKAYKYFSGLLGLLEKCSSYKVVSVPRTEGDDVVFTLSDYLGDQDKEVIIYSSDHDFIQCLRHPNVKFWRTTRTTGMDNSSFHELLEEEYDELIHQHVIQGDKGDGVRNIKAYSEFSDEFLELYPKHKGKELQVYPKRYELDVTFKEKHGSSAYKTKRYGYKMLKRSKKTIEEVLDENPIYRMNFELNQKLVLPDHIAPEIKDSIIKEYENASNQRDPKCITKYFQEHRLTKLIAKIPFM